MKYTITENRLNQVAMKWLNMNYGDLDPVENPRSSEKSNLIFFIKDGEVIIDYNKKNGIAYINYIMVWSFLESMFGMSDTQIQDITKEWVEEQYKLKVTITIGRFLEDIF